MSRVSPVRLHGDVPLNTLDLNGFDAQSKEAFYLLLTTIKSITSHNSLLNSLFMYVILLNNYVEICFYNYIASASYSSFKIWKWVSECCMWLYGSSVVWVRLTFCGDEIHSLNSDLRQWCQVVAIQSNNRIVFTGLIKCTTQVSMLSTVYTFQSVLCAVWHTD